MSTPTFTVFTPTYNRAHTLPRLYKSIQELSIRDFEWVIVDDGSTDNTADLVRQWQAEDNDFPIRYFWQANLHKKVAFNYGVREALGKWFVPVDSDDELLPESLTHFQNTWLSIPESDYDRFVCVVGLCVNDQKQIVGNPFPQDPLDASSVELFFDYKIGGDKAGCHRTDVLKKYPFPEDIPNLVPESVVWFRIAKQYTQRNFNLPVYLNHHDVESLTRQTNAFNERADRAEGALLFYAEALNWISWKRCLRSPIRVIFLSAQYNRWSHYLPPEIRLKHRPTGRFAKLLAFLCKPLGWLIYIADKKQITESLRRFGIRIY